MVKLSDFNTSFTCSRECGAFNAEQDIRQTKEGRIYRICRQCNCTNDVYIPSHTKVISYKNTSRCASCNCRDYQPVHGIECQCGHLGSYHVSNNVPDQTQQVKARVKKSELKSTGLSFDINSVDDF